MFGFPGTTIIWPGRKLRTMAKSSDTSGVAHGWFAQQWLKTLEKSQADVCRALGWPKAKASDLISGKQRYNQDAVEDLAAFLNLRPFELLLHPEDAMQLRQLKRSADQIARMSVFRDVLGETAQPEAAEPEQEKERPKRRGAA